MSDTGWSAFLRPDEILLWEGRPDGAIIFSPIRPAEQGMGLFFCAFSIFWMATASAGGGVFWLFGLPFFLIGLFSAVGVFFWRAYLRRHSWYALTNERALIATELPFQGRRLDSYPIDARAEISLMPGPRATVIFAKMEKRGNKGRTYFQDIGFERIEDGSSVYQQLLAVQRGEDVHAL